MSKKMHLLIIGASGYIGRNLFEEAKRRNIEVIGTKLKSEEEKYTHFNMLEDDIESTLQNYKVAEKKKYAVICSGDSSIDFCYTEYKAAYMKNVTAAKILIAKLNKLGYRVIFLSTDCVFSGSDKNYREEDIKVPINKYGEMKAEVEDFILENYPHNCVLRLGKVVGDAACQNDLFVDWYLKALNRKEILCIKGNLFTPTYIGDIVNCILLTANLNLTGVYHINSGEIQDRFTLCHSFLEKMGEKANVREISLEEFHFKDTRSICTVLDNFKFKKETGYIYTNMDEVIAHYESLYCSELNTKKRL